MTALVSLCMIVKDEEDDIALALDSARPFADELVVYDTGSSDATVEIARARGARVIEGYWDDDFARARNDSLSHCNGTWVLWLDADESVHGDLAAMRARLAAAPEEAEAWVVSIENLEGGGLGGHNAFMAMRLFRRSACQFEGRLHEQVVRRDGGGTPGALQAAELRILHRGYVAAQFSDGSKYERNLRLAREALEDPEEDHAVALFNYGRTLMLGPNPGDGVEPLEEAASLTETPTTKRYALQTLAGLQLGLGQLDEALAVISELRRCSTRQVTADVLEARVHFAAGEYRSVLEVSERVPYIDTDDDGVECGRHLVAALRASAFAGLGRPGEAADELLGALKSHGVLDAPLPVLAGYLLDAGRSLDELAGAVRDDIVPVFAATAVTLPPAQADVVVTALHERFPARPEPLAVAATLATRLPVARALWWSAQLRRRGFEQRCPLVVMVANAELEPLVRLRAAAAAFASFAEQRVVEATRQILAGEPDGGRAALLGEVRAISPALAELVQPQAASVAVLLTLDGETRDGYRPLTTRSGTAVELVDPACLPLPSGGAHLLHVRGVLAAAPRSSAGSLLEEWQRVLRPGGELVVEVPDLAGAARRLLAQLDGSPAAGERPGAELELLRELYGPRRFGADGAAEAFCTGWTRRALEAELAGHGFAVTSVTEGRELRVQATAVELSERLPDPATPGAEAPLVSVVVVPEHGADALQRCLRAVAGCDAGAEYEVVCLADSADTASAGFLTSLGGAATVLSAPLPLHRSAAINLATRRANGRIVVLLRDTVEVSAGWAGLLAAALADDAVAAASAVLVDAEGTRRGGALSLRGDATQPRLEHRPAVGSEAEALGAGCLALRIETWRSLGGLHCGLQLDDAVLDLSLRASRRGRLVAIETVRALVHEATIGRAAGGDTTAEHLAAASAAELAHRWAGQLELAAPEAPRLTNANLLPTTTLLDRIDRVAEVPIGSPRTGGCNLVGDFAAETALSGRVLGWQAAHAAAGLPCSPLGYRNGRVDVALAEREPLAFDTTLLCLSGEDLVEYVARVGLESLRGRYTILDWHWPFAEPAPATAGEASMVGEIWVPSRFTQQALRKVTPRPVRLQPVPVLPARAQLDRGELSMPEGFVFVTQVDVGKGRPGDVALANPLGAVESFCAAFPAASGPSLFVALAGTRTEATAEACREAAAGRNDVVVADTLPPAGAESMLALADCYVSLHRSSAFDLPLAQALASGVPVVASRCAGPLEYLDDVVADLVETVPATTSEEHLPYPAGLSWWEPDLDDAAAALWNVADEPDQARAKARLGAIRLGRSHGADTAGRMLRQRVEAVAPLRPKLPHEHRSHRRARR